MFKVYEKENYKGNYCQDISPVQGTTNRQFCALTQMTQVTPNSIQKPGLGQMTSRL